MIHQETVMVSSGTFKSLKNIFRLCSDVSDGNENEIISENTKLNSGA